MSIASRFLTTFGEQAFITDHETALRALQWLSDNDPNGTGQLVDGAFLYHFSDSSSLIFDRVSGLFRRPQ